jgi:hypothetical protein
MATAKTPKKIPAAARAAVKPAPAPQVVKAKPAPARAAVAKAPEDAIVHSAEIATKSVVQPAEKVAPEVTKAAEKITEVAAKAPEIAVTTAAKAPQIAVEAVSTAAESVTEIAHTPSKAVAVVAKAADKAQDSVLKGVVPFLDFSRDHAILLVAAGNEIALGLHKLSLSLIDWSAESCDKGVAAGQAILSAKTVEEVLDLSQTLAKDGFDQLLKEGSELSALSSKLIEDTLVPLPGRLVAAVEKLASHAA